MINVYHYSEYICTHPKNKKYFQVPFLVLQLVQNWGLVPLSENKSVEITNFVVRNVHNHNIDQINARIQLVGPILWLSAKLVVLTNLF